eukprot:11195542-Lingulodinium_polyedra.AAC.1
MFVSPNPRPPSGILRVCIAKGHGSAANPPFGSGFHGAVHRVKRTYALNRVSGNVELRSKQAHA